MGISRIFLCFCALMAAVCVEASPCSDEMPCQPGFLCSVDYQCKPTLSSDSQSLPNDLHISGLSARRITRKAKKPLDYHEEYNREMLIDLGTEGIEDDHHSEPTPEVGHRKHKHHPHPHKLKNHRIHRSAGDMVSTPERADLQHQDDNTSTTSNKEELSIFQPLDILLEMMLLSPMKHWTSYYNRDLLDSQMKSKHRSKRSIHTMSQWQKVLDSLTLANAGGVAKHPSTDTNSDSLKQLETLDEIIHQLQKEVASKDITSNGHHKHHPSADVEAKKEEIQVLQDIEDSLQHQTHSQVDNGVDHTTGANAQRTEHSYKHVQQHEQQADSHSTTDTGVLSNLKELEGMVLEDVAEAERAGMTRKEGAQLEKEVEGLEVLEKQNIEDLIKNSGSQTNLAEVEDKVQLWGVLQQLVEKLKTELPNTKPSREARSTGVDITNRGSLLSLLQNTIGKLRAKRHRKQTHSHQPIPPANTKQQAMAATSPDTKVLNIDLEEMEIGRVDQEHCQRCEPLIGEEVCGANGRTYVSLCHAVNCAGLRESDIIAGRCVEEDECARNKCSDHEECVPMLHGTCLVLYSKDGLNKIPCRRYVCVPKEECESDVDHEQVCGEDGKTYPSLCYLHRAEVQLAYTGSCRPHLCRGEVCGRDGVTYESSCHARVRGVRIDYNGKCFTEDRYSKLVNCATVRDAGRCVKPLCSGPVIPAGACCPICGGAVIVHPDSVALSELAESWEEVNHLYVVENFLRHLLSKDEALKCELTATLTTNGSFSVVLSATTAANHKICQTAANNLVQTVNRNPRAQDAMLHPVALKATLLNPLNPESMIKGYLIGAQNSAMSKAYNLRDQALTNAEKTLVDADRQVKNRQIQMELERASINSALGLPLSFVAWTVTCAVMFVLLLM